MSAIQKAPEAWHQRYKGLSLEAVFYNGHWCGYVYIPIDKGQNTAKAEELWFDPTLDEQSGIYMYHTSRQDILANCPAHGGVTFYQKFFAIHSKIPYPPEARLVKVGWDYNHYMDEMYTFTLESTMRDAEMIADYFIRELGIEVVSAE